MHSADAAPPHAFLTILNTLVRCIVTNALRTVYHLYINEHDGASGLGFMIRDKYFTRERSCNSITKKKNQTQSNFFQAGSKLGNNYTMHAR